MLTVVAGNHLRLLARAMAHAWIRPGDGPDLVLVQSTALASWLRRRLAEDWGIAADLELALPAEWLARLGAPEPAGWRAAALRWRLEAAVPDGEAPTEPLARHRFLVQLARAIDAWQLQRPEALAAWGRGEGGPPWLARTWRALVDDAVRGGLGPDRGRMMAALAAAVRRGDLALPPRLGAFAIGQMPPAWIELFAALGDATEMTLWLWSPVARPWADDDAGGHPLAARLGVHGRRGWRALGTDAIAAAWHELPPVVPARTTLLGAIQADIAEQTAPRPAGPADDDRSIAFHDCPGERRELEVLHAAIAEALAAGTRPGDIGVLMSDPARYAPLIPAVFDRPLAGGQVVPWTIADRKLRDDDPLAGALLAVAALAGGRRPRSAVLALLRRDPVPAALGLPPDELDAAIADLDRAGVRWGGDRAGRSGLGGTAEGTWEMARDRIVAGWWLGPCGHPDLPVAGDLLADAAPAARVLHWLAALMDLLDRAERPQPAAAWLAWSRQALARLLLPPAPHGDEGVVLRRLLDELGAAWDGEGPVLAPAVWHEVLAGACAEAAAPAACSGAAGGPGGVVFAGLHALRGVPFSFLALIGQSDDLVPRRPQAPAWDLLASPRRSGDPDPRGEDRQLVLEAVLAAGGHLHVSWVGRDARTGLMRPASVCVEALRAAIDATAGAGTAARLTGVAPRHAGGGGHDPLAAAVAAALAGERAPEAPFLPPAPLPPAADAAGPWHTDLDELIRILADPAAACLRWRLDCDPPGDDDGDPGDDEPHEVGPLAAWRLRHELAAAGIAGRPPPSPGLAAADGILPHGSLGEAAWLAAAEDAADLAGAVAAALDGEAWREEACVLDGPGWRLALRLPELHRGRRVLWTASRADRSARSELVAWLAATAANCLAPCEVQLIGSDGAEHAIIVPPAPSAAAARERLQRIVDLARRCRSGPVPLALRCGHALAASGDPARAWAAYGDGPGDGDEREQTDLGRSAACALLWRGRPIPGEAGFAAAVEALWSGRFEQPRRRGRR